MSQDNKTCPLCLLLTHRTFYCNLFTLNLGLIKNFVKALNREGPAFQYIIKLFPKLSYAKIEEGIFVGADIRKPMADAKFTKCLTPDEPATEFRLFLRCDRSPSV
ncbi:hypothetical protein EVAR_25633_1 [Eumeta japonica]|uniref:Uncharacterized protein n=1 Tax=Eumeta variegata TaxID=151549 RepID=A0A4C1V0S8_EUMVA|nr:hypothetical protein EVAR_25633_1 [Eumeta japonica]